MAEEAKTHKRAKILCPRNEVWAILVGSNQVRGV